MSAFASSLSSSWSIATLLVHADGAASDAIEIAPPIHVTTTYRTPVAMLQQAAAAAEAASASSSSSSSLAAATATAATASATPPPPVYARQEHGNATRLRVERVLGALEVAGLANAAPSHAVLYASGQAATFALLIALRPRTICISAGYHASRYAVDLYRSTTTTDDRGESSSSVRVFSLDELFAAADATTSPTTATFPPHIDLIWVESPHNPTGDVPDLERIVAIARRFGALVAVDSTMASPLVQQPLAYDCDVVMHSCTKYLGGHSDLLAGALVTRSSSLAQRLVQQRTLTGAILGAHDTHTLLRSLRTYSLRVERQCANAWQIAQTLDAWRRGDDNDVAPARSRSGSSQLITSVLHPWLPSHPSHAIAKRQLRLPLATFSFCLVTPTLAATFVTHLELIPVATSLGGVETLIDYRYLYDRSNDPCLLRLSVGIEDANDLLRDIEQALQRVAYYA